jgi:hypothetical protein
MYLKQSARETADAVADLEFAALQLNRHKTRFYQMANTSKDVARAKMKQNE